MVCEPRSRTDVGGDMATRQPSDVSEYAEFVAARSASMFRTAYLVIGDYQMAEDLLQESLVKALRRNQRSNVCTGCGAEATGAPGPADSRMAVRPPRRRTRL